MKASTPMPQMSAATPTSSLATFSGAEIKQTDVYRESLATCAVIGGNVALSENGNVSAECMARERVSVPVDTCQQYLHSNNMQLCVQI